ncbi:ABC-type (unclassified) transport system, ATPase component [Synechococcus sp. PCC 7502]|uniref:LPS export ABC transporter ATP-binding protein n=1 Tax=Synechococcus sp. PCC 7502 TaxID=1173263 RepID=UPI00029FA781|nr:LPS export ABC transporter ATP-binding protein [Synechococcus sp. PCC 7502]AFY72848.1 ABC-type (unclassified) transport system, ATPase component [Synechococcus sp. PCC 7502]
MKIALDNVSKVYGQRQVLHQVSFNVDQGEIVGLLGPNGAGKTTSFYITTGLVQPDQGRVFLGDRNITDLPIHQRARLGMAYLAQEPTIFQNLSVRDNLLLVMEQAHIPLRQRQAEINLLLEEFRLTSVANSKGIQLSGGERRRAEIARALAIHPKFLLLDEPFAGIDPIIVAEIQEIISKLSDRNIGILITDHNVRETLAITDRSYILRDGEILAAGTSKQLASNPEVRKYYLGENFQF